jgi:plastocyanin
MSPARASGRKRPWRIAAALCLAAAPAGLVACGDDKESSSAPKKLQIEATGGGKSVQITAPKSADAGLVEITFKNSAKDPQEAQIVRVDGNHTAAEVIKVVGSDGGPIPGWLSGGGGVGQTNPGETRTVTQKLSAGKYYVTDSNVEGKAAIVPLTLEGDGGGELSSTAATITAKEYGFTLSGLKPGKNEVTFKNSGKQLHHVIALPINKGATLDDVKKAFQEDNPSGPPPFDEEKATGTAVIDGGESQVTDLTLQKGKYAVVCFIQDRAGGPPHAVKGMVAEADVR